MQKRWIFPRKIGDKSVIEFSKSLNISPAVSKILIDRGYDTIDKANHFLNPKLDDLHNPLLFSDMNKAIERIKFAIKNKEKIIIYGDYDVDGITGTSLLYLALKRLGAIVSYYLPNRLIEGYGLNDDGIIKAKDNNVKLIITVDCGITGNEQVKLANSFGIDVIITDHHEPDKILPSAYCILNPKTCNYPFKDLSGVGVAFKLLQGLYKELGISNNELYEHLDLVALGTVADIVPLIDENRVLCKFGLLQIQKSKKVGIRALIEIIKAKQIDSWTIGFEIAPRLNATGRLGDADKSFQLLTTDNFLEAGTLADYLNAENIKRQSIEKRIKEEAIEMVNDTVDFEKDRVIVLANENWHRGVIGIVASRIVEEFYRPTILIALEDKVGHGSGRSISNFHLQEAIQECSEYLIRFGGHMHAAGLSIDIYNIDKFKDKFNSIAWKKLNKEDLMPSLDIDVVVNINEINDRLVYELSSFGPYGVGNPHPTVAITDVKFRYAKTMGKNNDHLKFYAYQDNSKLICVGFGLGEMCNSISDKVGNIAVNLEFNEYQGQRNIQGKLKDLNICTS